MAAPGGTPHTRAHAYRGNAASTTKPHGQLIQHTTHLVARAPASEVCLAARMMTLEATARTAVSLAVAVVSTHAPGLVRLVVGVPVVRCCLLARGGFPQRIAELEER